MADENLSGVPPVVTLSGLQGVPSFSGAGQGAPGGGISGAQPGLTPGIEGGPDLLTLLLQQAGQGSAGDVGVGGLTPFTAQSLGQQTGGIGAGAFGQGGGQGLIAGGMGAGAGAQQATGAGSVDPLAILQKLLGLGSKAAALAGSLGQTASPTMGDTGGVSTSDQLRSQQAAQGGNATLNGIQAAPTASPTVDVNAPGVPPGLSDPNALGGLPGDQAASPTTLGFLNQAQGGPGGVPLGTQNQELIQALLGAGMDSDQIAQIFGSSSFGPSGAGEIPVPSGGVSGAPTASPTGLSGVASGGLGSLQGLLSAYLALQGQGSDLNKALGVTQGLSGAASGGAAVSDALGATSGLGSTVGGVAGAIGPLLTAAQIIGNPVTEAGQNSQAQQAALASLSALTTGSGVGAFAAPVLGAIMAIMDATSRPGNREINRVSGILGPQITSELGAEVKGVPSDLSGMNTQQLESLLPQLGAGLQGLYSPAGAEGGEGQGSGTAISRYRTGLQSADPQAAAYIQQLQDRATSGLLQDIGLLQKQGVGNDVIGGLLGGGDAEATRIAGLNAGGSPMNSASFAGLPPELQRAFQQGMDPLAQAGGTAPSPFGTGSYGSNLNAPNFWQQAFGGNTWSLLNKLGLDTPAQFAQYGIQAPGFNQGYLQNLMNAPLSNLAQTQAAQQYNPGMAATPEQIALQYGITPDLGALG